MEACGWEIVKNESLNILLTRFEFTSNGILMGFHLIGKLGRHLRTFEFRINLWFIEETTAAFRKF